MPNQKLKLIMLALLTSISFSSNAEVSAIQQQVLDNYSAMKNMSSQQRKAFRAKIYADMSRSETKAYTQAYKQVRGMLPNYLGVTNATDPAKVEKKSIPSTKRINRVPGTNITYDTGTVSGTAGIDSQMLGNRFDFALNSAGTMAGFPVESSGSITMITFSMVNTFFSSAAFSLYSNINGTTAMQVVSKGRTARPGLNTLSIMSTATANVYNNGAFLAGIFQFMSASTALGVDTGTVGGQGFHAISINDASTGTMLTSIPSRNAIFRVSGNVATPIELINFTIE